MTFITFIKSLFATEKQHELGALLDTRPQEEKDKDYKLEEIVASVASVDWKEKPKSEWRSFGVQNQITSSSCVAQSVRKAMRVLFKVNHNLDLDFSASDIYRRRSNKPREGMSGPDAFSIASKGVTLNALMPSDNKTEYEMNNAKSIDGTDIVREVFKIPNYVALPIKDFETVASTIQKTSKGVVLFYFFTRAEWAIEKPTVKSGTLFIGSSLALHHGVCAVDAFLVNGKKHLLVEDSAHFMGLTYHLISEEFHNNRNYYAAYPIRFAFDKVGKPSYNGTIKSLQDCLKAEGLFPSNVESTGFYGAITIKAVNEFQKKYSIDLVGTGTVGTNTKIQLHELYP